MADVLEPESGAEPAQALDSSSIAVALALNPPKGRALSAVERFLGRQEQLVAKQLHHLDEQLLILRLDGWSRRLRLALQGLTILVGVLVLAAVAVMAWQAREDHGVAIEAFSVPPDLAQRGMTGQVVASELLDGLASLQEKTVTARPGSTYANDWGGDIKVEIPETGVSIGELSRYLRDWLGSQTRITGEVVRTPTGIAVTARAGAAPGRRFEGAEADLDKLIGQAAEAVYAETQPYRYAVWLSAQGRRDEALATYARLAASGPAEERAWAYAGWASMLYLEARRAGWRAGSPPEMAESVRLADIAMRLEPRLFPAYPIRGNGLWILGRAEAAEAQVRREIAMHRRGEFIGLPKSLSASRLTVMRGVDAFQTGDFQSAAALLRQAGTSIDYEGQADAWNGKGVMAQALADDHDVTASIQVSGASAPSEQAIALDDWASVARALQAGGGDQRSRARLYAHVGRFAEAESILAGMPSDCYQCLRIRGLTAALKHDWPAADRWYAEAARQAPSLPFAHSEWGQALLDKGDLDGAIAKFEEAHRLSPHFADPLELWGEALMRKGDLASAVSKFAEADRDAPRWGRNHLRWGEALMLSGRYAEARRQYDAAARMDLSKPDRAALNVLLARTANGPLRG
jgi:tetratricopeptide (TPR) repeat protein